jgi:hypothetical protein
MEDKKIIEWFLDDENFSELRRISLVTAPASEEEFLLFSEDLMRFKTIDEERKVVTGVAMRPNIKIPRNDKSGEIYWGFFSESTVRKAAQLFFKKGSNTNLTNLEHEYEVDGIYVFESWIVEDPEMDKAKALGFSDIKKGDWFVSMKVENEIVWDNYLKTGIIRGFSVEVRPKEKEVQVFDKIKNILESNDNEEVQFEAIKAVLSNQ